MALKRAILQEKNSLTHDVIELKFTTEDEFVFQPGQFITIKINDQSKTPCFRAYSISSAPNLKDFKVCVKVVEAGRGSNWLNTLNTGDKIEFIGPNGKFLFTQDINKNIIFIATGTGIAPFKSMIESELSKRNTQKMHLIFGARHEKDIFYAEHFENLANVHHNFTFEITLSQPETKNWNGNVGRVTSILEKITIENDNTEIYICGLTPMINDVNTLLQNKQIPKEAIHFEKYD